VTCGRETDGDAKEQRQGWGGYLNPRDLFIVALAASVAFVVGVGSRDQMTGSQQHPRLPNLTSRKAGGKSAGKEGKVGARHKVLG
jgi:hypothetical protein